MKIASTQYSVNTKSLEIYITGCKGNCKGCHNPELKDYHIGTDLSIEFLNKILDKINEFDSVIDNVWILGGEPLDQKTADLHLLLVFMNISKKKIWLFTRHKIEDIPAEIKSLCDFIKCGEYNENLIVEDYFVEGLKLPTRNQLLYKKEGGNFIVQSPYTT